MANAQVDYRLPEELQGNVLEQIMRDRMREIRGAKLKWPAAAIEMALPRAPAVRSLRKALAQRSPGIIAEIKRASPSAGTLCADFDPAKIAQEYQKAGAAAISVVTENKHFRGRLETVSELRWSSEVPLLRKDFIIDSYQILEARHAGADALLLITSLLDASSLRRLCAETERLGMEALIEVHDEGEIENALAAGAKLIGVNNRDLCSFQVSLEVSMRLGPRIPEDVIAVSESGIRTADDIRRLRDVGFRGFLIGETLMRASSPGEALAGLISSPALARRNAR